jgi:hypothetical protein
MGWVVVLIEGIEWETMVYRIRHTGMLQRAMMLVSVYTVTVIIAVHLFSDLSRSLRAWHWLESSKPRKAMHR